MLTKNTLNEFAYKKATGDVSNRSAFVVSVPSNKYFCIDLTEFEEDERVGYMVALKELYETHNESLKNSIKEMGLSGNYRQFLEEGIIEG